MFTRGTGLGGLYAPPRELARRTTRMWPKGPDATTRVGLKIPSHLCGVRETESRVHPFPERRGVQEQDGNASGPTPPNRFANDAGRMALSAVRRLSEHREEVCRLRPFPLRPRLNLHEPYAAARDGLAISIDDERGQPAGLHSRASPTTVHSICGVKFFQGNIRDRGPHEATVADEKIEVVQVRGPNRRACHGSRGFSPTIYCFVSNVGVEGEHENLVLGARRSTASRGILM